MSLPHRVRGVKVLKAISSPMRLHLLNLLFDKGALSYTEIMNQLKMHPSRDAGRFAYHLKFLLNSNLVEVDTEAKKYFLTELGKMVIDIAERVDKKALKPRGMLVRTSHSTLEEFDSNKIANSLIREAKIPTDLAQRTAKETEKLLQKSKIKYLTSPLIREIVNAILIEKGQEEYRHKLTRLGMPVHEVTALIDSREMQGASAMILQAGEHTLTEYNLLNVFPRDMADAHTSGALHTTHVGTWLLKPDEVMHDLRFFLKNGFRPVNPLQLTSKPPQTFEEALSTIFNALLRSSEEINEMQTCHHFNTFLAPFLNGTEPVKSKQALRLFLFNLQSIGTTLVLDTILPKFLADKSAITPEGKAIGNYGDFVEEADLLAEQIIDIFSEESNSMPMINPSLVVEITNESLTGDQRNILTKAHGLAAEKGIIYFDNATSDEGKNRTFSSTGCKLETDITGDWETDIMRTGCMGTVTINLPRIVHESEREPNKFFEILRERYEMANRALEIKQRALKQHSKNCLPFLTQNTAGEAYFRLEKCSGLINLAGFEESTRGFPSEIDGEQNLNFAEEIVQNMITFKQKLGKKHGKRIFPTIIRNQQASERLAQLDIEKYGVAKTRFSGTRDKPFYSTSKRLQLESGKLRAQSLAFGKRLKGLDCGANLNVVDLEQADFKPDDLLNLTRQLVQMKSIELFTYNRKITYCSNCQKSWIGTLTKCPSCGAVSTLILFDRFIGT